MKSIRSNNHNFTLSVYKDIGTRKFEFVAKTQFLQQKHTKKSVSGENT